MALLVDGRDQDLTRSHLRSFARRFGLREQALDQILDRLCDAIPRIDRVHEIGFDERRTDHLRREMRRRRGQLGDG